MNFIEKIYVLINLIFYSEHYHSLASESKVLVNNKKCILKSGIVANASASDLYLLVFDATAEPAAATAPTFQIPIAANTIGTYDFDKIMLNGVYMALSTTQFTYTDAGVNASFNIKYQNL